MIGTVGTLDKQPGETKVARVSFADWLADHGDTIASVTATPSSNALVIEEVDHAAGIVSVFISGGVHKGTYKVTIKVTTARAPTPLVEEAEVVVKVKES
ncbi:MAG TPA: hypothetical protein VNV16_09650 [Methylibium sp.]|nr:hypothetical protein [Methylibium sp.]